MAELLVSAVLPVLFEKLTSGELLNFATQEGVRSKLKKWEKTLKMIEALLIDAEEKQLKNSCGDVAGRAPRFGLRCGGYLG
ncbi:hypothetical protein LWI28_026095 [Acer negundo]|uniref:Disease resistance N-terminal domain-containing protein n=1 Tax=Acer negundo TaxID=4023 RepID=A0AAD5NYR7_ACENE|nr:hypothetical protein LWI28_026095 [Acer negundo]